jgi:hypothetical protein
MIRYRIHSAQQNSLYQSASATGSATKTSQLLSELMQMKHTGQNFEALNICRSKVDSMAHLLPKCLYHAMPLEWTLV